MVDPMILVSLSDISNHMVMKRHTWRHIRDLIIVQCIQVKIPYYASGMALKIHSDEIYISKPKACSQVD